MNSVHPLTEKEMAQEILATLEELQIYAGLSAHQIKLRNAARQMLAEQPKTVHLTSPMFSRAVALTTGGQK